MEKVQIGITNVAQSVVQSVHSGGEWQETSGNNNKTEAPWVFFFNGIATDAFDLATYQKMWEHSQIHGMRSKRPQDLFLIMSIEMKTLSEYWKNS